MDTISVVRAKYFIYRGTTSIPRFVGGFLMKIGGTLWLAVAAVKEI